MGKPKVQFVQTPNPNAGKFVVGRQVTPVGTSRSYYTDEDAGDDPVAHDLMQLPGIRSIFMVDDFITVTKTPATTWDDLVPRVTEAIRDHL